MNIEKKLREERERLFNSIQKVREEYEQNKAIAGDDILWCSDCRGVSQYLLNGKYVSKKNITRIQAIAQRDYDEKLLEALDSKVSAIDKFLNFYVDDSIEQVYLKQCTARRKLITPLNTLKQEYIKKWTEEKYEPYDRWDDVKSEIYTRKGERVRSKAEKIIADELTAYGVPYKYEYPLELSDGRQRKTFRPDFMALNCRTREEFVIEHLGMMDKMGYFNFSMNKLDIYEHNGYILGINLLIFHETSECPLSVPVVRRYIEEYLL